MHHCTTNASSPCVLIIRGAAETLGASRRTKAQGRHNDDAIAFAYQERCMLASIAGVQGRRDNWVMLGPIICGVGDREGTQEAVRVACDFSQRLGRPLVLVHVRPANVPPGTSAVPHARSELLERERRQAELLLAERVVELSLRTDVEGLVVFGDPVQRLLEVAADECAELMVLGSRRRGSVASALLGSVSSRVAATAPCPVVIVPAGVAIDGAGPGRGE